MNQDLMNQLQQLASGKVYTQANSYENTTKITASDFKNKLNTLENSIKTMYSKNPDKVFETFKQQTKDILFPTTQSKEFYWNKYLDLAPNGREEAKKLLIRDTERDINTMSSPSEKEFFLRDKISRFPSWLSEEFASDIKNLSFRNAYSNLNKAKQLYKDDLSKRLTKLNGKELDPDVGADSHINDLMKLEKMNLLDVADSLGGRYGVTDKGGSFVPAFNLENRSQVFRDNDAGSPSTNEQLMVDELAPDFVRNHVTGSLGVQRTRVNVDNRTTEGIASMMLEQGKFKIPEWHEAFSMFAQPNYPTLIETGLKGEINSGRVQSDEDLSKAIYIAMNTYKDFLGDTTNATNT